MERYIYTAIYIIITFTFLFLAIKISAYKTIRTVTMVISLIIICAFVFIVRTPALWLQFAGVRPYIYFEHSWGGWFALLFFFSASAEMGQKRGSKMLIVFAVIVMLYFLWNSALFLVPLDKNSFTPKYSDSGYCLQSTDYTCGAASMVNLLDYYGIQTTEGEMVVSSSTRPRFGISDLGIYHALSDRTQDTDYHPVIKKMSLSELKTLDHPVIASTKLTLLIGHAIYLSGYSGGMFRAIDPISGERDVSESEMQAIFKGVVIYLAEN